jgi:hypothetical protein
VAAGGAVSTMSHSYVAVSGSASRFAFVAVTSNVCVAPARTPVSVFGDTHGAIARPSSVHWNDAVVSVELNVNVASDESVPVVGPVSIVTSGATR